MSIFIVRHAETDGNSGHIIQVPATPLSEAGRLQAKMLAERVAVMGIERILASDLIRAVETATYVSVRTGVEIELDPIFSERDFGDLRGTPYTALTVDPFGTNYTPPGGESWAAFYARVALAWSRITYAAAEISGNLLVVTHGLFCRALVERQLTLLPDDFAPSRCENTSLTEVDATPPWTIRRLNCTAHLKDAC
jgi:broad specificity phosphatase PhoE